LLSRGDLDPEPILQPLLARDQPVDQFPVVQGDAIALEYLKGEPYGHLGAVLAQQVDRLIEDRVLGAELTFTPDHWSAFTASLK
jgi:hypothetical protein